MENNQLGKSPIKKKGWHSTPFFGVWFCGRPLHWARQLLQQVSTVSAVGNGQCCRSMYLMQVNQNVLYSYCCTKWCVSRAKLTRRHPALLYFSLNSIGLWLPVSSRTHTHTRAHPRHTQYILQSDDVLPFHSFLRWTHGHRRFRAVEQEIGMYR